MRCDAREGESSLGGHRFYGFGLVLAHISLGFHHHHLRGAIGSVQEAQVKSGIKDCE